MKLTWRLLAPLFVLALAFTSGCNSAAKLGGVTAKITELRLTATGAELTLHYTNENIIAIAVSTTTHELSLNGKSVGKIRTQDAVGLPQLGTATQKVILPLNDAAYVQTLGNSASYRLETRLLINSGDDRLTLDLKSEGTVPIVK